MIPGGLSKPPPSAARPPHRTRKLSINDITTCANALAPRIVPEIVPATVKQKAIGGTTSHPRTSSRNATVFLAGAFPASRSARCGWTPEPTSTSSVSRVASSQMNRGRVESRVPTKAAVYQTDAFSQASRDRILSQSAVRPRLTGSQERCVEHVQEAPNVKPCRVGHDDRAEAVSKVHAASCSETHQPAHLVKEARGRDLQCATRVSKLRNRRHQGSHPAHRRGADTCSRARRSQSTTAAAPAKASAPRGGRSRIIASSAKRRRRPRKTSTRVRSHDPGSARLDVTHRP